VRIRYILAVIVRLAILGRNQRRHHFAAAERAVAVGAAAYLLGLDVAFGRPATNTNVAYLLQFYREHAVAALFSAAVSVLLAIVITASVVQLSAALKRFDQSAEWQVVAVLVIGSMSVLIAITQIWLALHAHTATITDIAWSIERLQDAQSIRLVGMLGIAVIAIPTLLPGERGAHLWRRLTPCFVAAFAGLLMVFTPYGQEVFVVWAAYTVYVVTGRLNRLPAGTIIKTR
jgi:hypothetical protein